VSKVSVLIAICFVLALALSLMGQNQQNQNALKNIMTQVDPAWTSLQMNLDSSNAAGWQLTQQNCRGCLMPPRGSSRR
jgi:hypothetical protein